MQNSIPNQAKPILEIDGATHELNFSNRARYRWGRLGGSIPAMFTPGQDYYQVCAMLWSALPDEVRSTIEPEDLADVVDPHNCDRYAPAMQAMIAAWYPAGIESGPVSPDALSMVRPQRHPSEQ